MSATCYNCYYQFSFWKYKFSSYIIGGEDECKYIICPKCKKRNGAICPQCSSHGTLSSSTRSTTDHKKLSAYEWEWNTTDTRTIKCSNCSYSLQQRRYSYAKDKFSRPAPGTDDGGPYVDRTERKTDWPKAPFKKDIEVWWF